MLPPETDEDLGTALATSGVDKLGDDDRKEVGMYSSSTGWLVGCQTRKSQKPRVGRRTVLAIFTMIGCFSFLIQIYARTVAMYACMYVWM
jgi:hypothetical protein